MIWSELAFILSISSYTVNILLYCYFEKMYRAMCSNNAFQLTYLTVTKGFVFFAVIKEINRTYKTHKEHRYYCNSLGTSMQLTLVRYVPVSSLKCVRMSCLLVLVLVCFAFFNIYCWSQCSYFLLIPKEIISSEYLKPTLTCCVTSFTV